MKLTAHIPLTVFYVPNFMGWSLTLSEFLSPGVTHFKRRKRNQSAKVCKGKRCQLSPSCLGPLHVHSPFTSFPESMFSFC